MERTRRILTISVLSGFVVLALMPFLGIHPVNLARNGFAALTTSEQAPQAESPAHSVLLAGLDSDDPELVKAAIYALANQLESDEISMMFPIVTGDYHQEVQKAALYAIGNHETAEVRQFLTTVALEHERAELAKAATYALANTGSEEAVPALIRVMSSDAPTEVRKAAVHALGNVDSDAARKALMDLIEKR